MKIYRSKHGSFYFGQTKENGWFCFSSQVPKIDTLNLCPCMFGNEEEKTAWDEGIDVPKDIEFNVFNKFARRTYNYKDLCKFIKMFYPDVTQEELDKKYNYYPDLIKLTDKIIKESGRNVDNFSYGEIYRDVKSHIQEWDNDLERVKKFTIEHDIPKHMSFDHAYIDIFGEYHPTKHFLLYEFYHHWGDSLDSIIDKAVELYPDTKDYDKAYYYVKEKLAEERERDLAEFKKKHKKK